MGEHLDKAKGTIKENVGDMTDDERLEREGKMDRAGADVKEKASDAVDGVKDAVRDLTDRDD
ncbi:MAG: CsbD family protein [Actinomycetota bacterium]